jgi:hypothetical protein
MLIELNVQFVLVKVHVAACTPQTPWRRLQKPWECRCLVQLPHQPLTDAATVSQLHRVKQWSI